MNKYAMDMMMRRDGRNPYGSRGGYVTSRDPRRRDRAYDSAEFEDGRRGVKGTGRYGIGGSRYYGRDRAEDYDDYNMSREYSDYNYEPDFGRGRGYGMFDYDMEDYRGYSYDGNNKLSKKDIKKWEKDLENADGTRGAKFDEEKVKQYAQQMNIKFEEFSPELLTAIVNMLYSDYCKVLGGDIAIYIKLAKAFLEDDDFDGTPEEKAMLYYKCIVEHD